MPSWSVGEENESADPGIPGMECFLSTADRESTRTRSSPRRVSWRNIEAAIGSGNAQGGFYAETVTAGSSRGGGRRRCRPQRPGSRVGGLVLARIRAAAPGASVSILTACSSAHLLLRGRSRASGRRGRSSRPTGTRSFIQSDESESQPRGLRAVSGTSLGTSGAERSSCSARRI